MKCPKCNTDNPINYNFCYKCKTQLKNKSEINLSITTETDEQQKKSFSNFSPGQYFSTRYFLMKKIGHGGMGQVYKAKDIILDRIVALKMIKSKDIIKHDIVKRFKEEVKLALQVTHENVCRIYDLGEVDGINYISMQYIEGQNLKEFLQASKKLSIETAIYITKQICKGLLAFHKEGILHRDLKPKNIMIDKRFHVYILDFGLAKSIKTIEEMKKNVIYGTPGYLSPEQAKGGKVKSSSDIYSLGVIMYEMMTGKPLFEASSKRELIFKHINEKPIEPSKLNPQIIKGLEDIILKCLEKNPKKRYQRPDEIINAIDEIIPEIIPSLSSVKTKKNSIAILPFTDLSSKKDHKYFCEGIVEELINALSNIKNLRVVAKRSSFRFKGKNLDIREIGKKLNADTVLEGTLKKTGNKLRITVQLINTTTGYILWSERYDSQIENMLKIQEMISLKLVNKLRLTLRIEEKALLLKRYTENIEAYNLYLKGRYSWNKRTEEGIYRGYKYFQQAIECDPIYALAFAGISDCYILLGSYYYLSPKDAYPKAMSAAEKALEIDESLAEAHNSLAWIRHSYEWDWSNAEKEYKHAINLKPNYAIAHQWYAHCLADMGKHEESIAIAKIAQELDPLSHSISISLGWFYYLARQYDQAIDQCQKTFELEPNYIRTYVLKGWIYAAKELYKKSISEIKKAIYLSDKSDPHLLGRLGIIYALSGKKNEAKVVIENLKNLSKHSQYISPVVISWIYAALGQKKLAFEFLKKAYIERDHWLAWIKEEPMLDNLDSASMHENFVKRIMFYNNLLKK